MSRFPADVGLLQTLYGHEKALGSLLEPFGIRFSPVAGHGFYNLPGLTPVTTETVTYAAGGTPVSDTYTGVSLWTLLQDQGLFTDPAIKSDVLRFGVAATGSDGYHALVSLGEIDPAFGNQPDLVTYADTGGQLGPGGSAGAMRLVLPGDHAGGRYVSSLVDLRVVDLTAPISG